MIFLLSLSLLRLPPHDSVRSWEKMVPLLTGLCIDVLLLVMVLLGKHVY